MSYTPTTWANGDTITAAKLNNMESGIEDAQNGWSYESTQLFSETVTTASQDGMVVGTLTYGSQIDASTLIVTFDGTDYTCNATNMGGHYVYGGIGSTGPDFTDYPFALSSSVNLGGVNMIYTETAGTHTIAVTASTLQTSADFAAAVAVASSPELFVATENATTWQEVHDAVSAGKFAYVLNEDSGDVFCYPVVAVTHGNTYQVATLQKSGSDVTLRYYIANTADGPIYPN